MFDNVRFMHLVADNINQEISLPLFGITGAVIYPPIASPAKSMLSLCTWFLPKLYECCAGHTSSHPHTTNIFSLLLGICCWHSFLLLWIIIWAVFTFFFSLLQSLRYDSRLWQNEAKKRFAFFRVKERRFLLVLWARALFYAIRDFFRCASQSVYT